MAEAHLDRLELFVEVIGSQDGFSSSARQIMNANAKILGSNCSF